MKKGSSGEKAFMNILPRKKQVKSVEEDKGDVEGWSEIGD